MPSGDGCARQPPLEHAAALRSRNERGAIPRIDFFTCDPRRSQTTTGASVRLADVVLIDT
jgi:hypothetical protein